MQRNSGVRLSSGRDLESVLKKRENDGKAFLCTAFAAGKIDDESGPAKTGDPSRKPSEGIGFCSSGPHGLGDPGGIAIDDAESGLRGAVAGTEAGTACGEDEVGAFIGPLHKRGGDGFFVVRDKAGFDGGLGPLLSEQRNDGRARSVGSKTLRAPVGDGEDGEEHEVIVATIWPAAL